ncbi:MAG: hypothetical protein IID46_10700 [Planctomycetes bacterium]|nr:hypothetical protein [Planctomycetota bacterium]
MADFARKPAIWEQLHRLGTYLEAVQPGDTSDPPEGLPFVEFLGTRPWKDLASESDYFSSAADFNYREEGEENEEGNEEKGKGKRRSDRWLVFMPFGNPRLRPPGDFVSRHGYST